VYLDTSAYLCLLLGQEGWERIGGLIDEAEILASVLLVLESRRSLVRLARQGSIPSEQYQACAARVETDSTRFVLRDLTLDLCESNAVPAVTTPGLWIWFTAHCALVAIVAANRSFCDHGHLAASCGEGTWTACLVDDAWPVRAIFRVPPKMTPSWDAGEYFRGR
jgi:hypothetical protein